MKSHFIIAVALSIAAAGLIVGGVIAAEVKKENTKTNEQKEATQNPYTGTTEVKKTAAIIKCPVTGKSVDSMGGKVAVDFEGGKVYFCCGMCPPTFKKDTAKYAAKAHLQMVETDQLKQIACPFTGKPLNPETAIDVGGVKVAFCCKDCMAKAEKAKGEEQVSLIFKDVSKGFKLAKDEAKK